MKISPFFIALFLISVSFPAYAGVVINEVAWMGTENSASDEWLELYSDDGEDLNGWTLFSQDGGMNVELSGTIPAGGYFLIERTDDTTVPEVEADLIAPFGSGLSNSGEILILKNVAGAEVDRVDGSGNWALGGSNTTKETLQKTSSGWGMAAATPRAANSETSSSSSSPSAEETPNNSADPSSVPAENSGWLPNPETKISAHAGADKTVLAGAISDFVGIAEDGAGKSLPSALFSWSFGDGATLQGKKVTHTFLYPGTYTVYLSVSLGDYSASDILKAAVIQNPLVISELRPSQWGAQAGGGFIELKNSSSRQIDISNFGLDLGGSKFFFPANTVLAAGAFPVFSEEVMGFSVAPAGSVRLLYPNGKILISEEYPAVLGPGQSLSFSEGEWTETKATPGAANETLKPIKKISVTSASASKPLLNAVPVVNAEAGSVSPQQLTSSVPPRSIFTGFRWLMIGLALSLLGSLAIVFIKHAAMRSLE
ncbi:lamin tail domain-containing protein [Candidatus Giovannonibacteria bacterium]|nr:lamin tail domain-containing protein [Candidatus Giovannonibacteria bacterium]